MTPDSNISFVGYQENGVTDRRGGRGRRAGEAKGKRRAAEKNHVRSFRNLGLKVSIQVDIWVKTHTRGLDARIQKMEILKFSTTEMMIGPRKMYISNTDTHTQ